jgi:hypothetical protein
MKWNCIKNGYAQAGNIRFPWNVASCEERGITLVCYSVQLMAQFNLLAWFETVIWPRIVLGVGMDANGCKFR